jgi:hypothetical protein
MCVASGPFRFFPQNVSPALIGKPRDRPGGRAVKYGDQLFPSLSAAAKAVTGHPTNGWVFWRPAEGSEQ